MTDKERPKRIATFAELQKAIAWFGANGMTAEEFVTETNKILRKEKEDIVNAVEKREVEKS